MELWYNNVYIIIGNATFLWKKQLINFKKN